MHEWIHELRLAPEERRIVTQILAAVLPEREVWAFGSRVHGRSLKRMSDLDLAIIGNAPLSSGESVELADAFDESLLPFKVDVLDWALTSDNFREIIRNEHVVVQHARQSLSEVPAGKDHSETA